MARFVIGKRARQADAPESSNSDSSKASWNTTRLSYKQKMPYSSRMAILFMVVAVITSLVLAIVLALVWEGEFSKYTRSNMQRLADAVATTLGERYEEEGAWTDDALRTATSSTLVSAGASIQVVDVAGNVLYDDTWGRTGQRRPAVGQADASSQVSLVPTENDAVVSAPILTPAGVQVGTVRVWVFGSETLLTKTDATFRSNSYAAILLAAVVAALLASLAGVRFARTLSKPVNRITATAAEIRDGNLSARTDLRGDDEIGQLGEMFDGMASRLEHDLKHEHRLTSDVAHELRTPLMAMQANVEAMQDGMLPANSENLGTVASEVKRLSRLVDAMLQLSRIENGTTAFHPERTDMVWLVRGVVSAQEQLFVDRDLRLRMEDNSSKRDGCFAEVDRDMMRQAVVNLLSNAMRYTPDGGWIVVSVSQDRTDALITVSDTGVGIAREDLPRVFGRFWRSEASRERVSGGMGVGLALTKEIIDRHHGFISVESELDHGTSFTLHVPFEYKENQNTRQPRDDGRQSESAQNEGESSTPD